MSALMWRSVGAAHPRRLGEARRQAHSAVQWLSRLAHSYMAPQPDARHTRLRWDPQRLALVTQEFLPALTVELRIPGLALQFKQDDRPVPHVMEVDDRTPAEVEAWVLVELLHRGLDRDRFSKSLPYQMPDLITGDAVGYVAAPLAAELDELAAWFTNAAEILAAIASEAPPASADAACPGAVVLARGLSPRRPSAAPSARFFARANAARRFLGRRRRQRSGLFLRDAPRHNRNAAVRQRPDSGELLGGETARRGRAGSSARRRRRPAQDGGEIAITVRAWSDGSPCPRRRPRAGCRARRSWPAPRSDRRDAASAHRSCSGS